MTDSTGTTTYTYDAADHLAKVAYPDGTFLAYSYDSAGRRVQMQDQTGFTVNYSYDALGRLSQLTDGGGASIVQYSYDSVGRLARQDMGNGTFTTYAYDADSEIVGIVTHAPDGTVLDQLLYTYDNAGRPISMTTLSGTFTYGYDADSQLTTVQEPDGTLIKYDYDAVGNRVSVTTNGAAAAYATNDVDEYTSGGNTTFTYDNAGNLITQSGPDGTTKYSYDVSGRLTGVISSSGTTTYQYNALGNLVSQVQNGQQTNFLVDPTGLSNIVGEFTSSGTAVAQFSYGNGLASQVQGDGTTSYYNFDAIGNTTSLTNAAGAVVNQYGWLPFGESLNSTTGVANPFTFGGQQGVLDVGNNLYLMRNRAYSSQVGRFLQPDPTGFLGGDVNLYRYARNNPVTEIDPTGLCPPTQSSNEQFQQQQDDLFKGIVVAPAAVITGTEALVTSVGYLSAINVTTTLTGIAGFQAGTLGASSVSVLSVTGAGLGAPVVIAGAASAAGGALIGYGIRQIPGVDSSIQLGFSQAFGYNLTEPGCPPNPDGALVAAGLTPAEIAKIHQLEAKGTGVGSAVTQVKGPAKAKQVLALLSHDPNEIIGPTGFGAASFLPAGSILPYEINFTNEAGASAPAQTVTVTQQLDPNLVLNTFQLGTIGFGDVTIDVPAGLSSFSTRVDATASVGVFVDVTADLNLETGVVTWTFTSIDPTTLDVPVGNNALEGFLPPDANPPLGEGFVTYTIQPKASTPDGTALNAKASIVFDTNAPIDTQQISNTIDSSAPTSSVNVLPATSFSTAIPLSWTGQDGDSGVASFDIFVSDNGGPFTPFLIDTTQTSATFTGQVGHTYGFFSVATDNVGNVQPTPPAAQASTTVSADSTPPTSSISVLPAFSKPTFTLVWSGSDNQGGSGIASFTIFVSDNGGAFTPFLTDTTQTSATFTGVGEHTYAFFSVATDNAGNTQTMPTSAQATTQTLLDTPDKKYVAAVYEALLLRSVDLGGLNFWSGQLDAGQARGLIAQELDHSAEYFQTNIIKPAYQEFLNRQADTGGLAFWTGQLQGGLTDEQMQAGFIASQEFYDIANGSTMPVQRSPAADKLYIDAIYEALLDRKADAAGESFWVSQLQGEQTPLQVANDFTGSTEGLSLRVQQTYERFLGRPADPGGLAFWLTQYAQGATDEDIITGFISSDEFFNGATK